MPNPSFKVRVFSSSKPLSSLTYFPLVALDITRLLHFYALSKQRATQQRLGDDLLVSAVHAPLVGHDKGDRFVYATPKLVLRSFTLPT